MKNLKIFKEAAFIHSVYVDVDICSANMLKSYNKTADRLCHNPNLIKNFWIGILKL